MKKRAQTLPSIWPEFLPFAVQLSPRKPQETDEGRLAMAIPDRLKAIREHLGETQKSMSRRFGLGENTWQAYELKGYLPKVETLVSLYNLGISVDWLLSGDGSMLRGGSGHPLNTDAMAQSIQLVEEWLQTHNRTMKPDKKAGVICTIYEMATEKAGQKIEPRTVGRILRLVS